MAKTTVNGLFIVGLGLVVGFLSGLSGVGGGTILTPLLIMIGIPPPVAAASDSNQIVASASSGAFAHRKLGNVDVKLGLVLLSGGIVGSTIGVQVIRVLKAMGNVDFFIKLVYVVVLGFVGFFMLKESYSTMKNGEASKNGGGFWCRMREANLPFKMKFPVSGIEVSAIFPFGMGLTVGLLAAIMGVGGGFIMMPAMIYILGMPTTVAIGTDLFQIVLTQVNTVVQQSYVNRTVDLVLAMLILLGSTVGAQMGARMTRRVRGPQLRFFLGLLVMAILVKLLLELLIMPEELIVLSSGGGGH